MEEETWWPSKQEYDPEITKEKWIELVTDKNIFTENSLIAFACLKEAGAATCTNLAESFGQNKNFYNNNILQTGERIYQKINCKLFEREAGENRFWPICCLGKKSSKRTFIYKIRDELLEAFDETEILENIKIGKFTWIPFYKELAQKILLYKNNHNELRNILFGLQKEYINYFHDSVKDVHPFLVFGIFNRGIKTENRKEICKALKEKLDIRADVPNDFAGIPVLNNMSAWWGNLGDKNEINENWELFEEALKDNFDEQKFTKYFTLVEKQSGAKFSLTMGLFWIFPERFLSLDGVNRQYLKTYGIDAKSEIILNGENYLKFINEIKGKMRNGEIKEKSFQEFSYNAWKKANSAEIKNAWLLTWNEKNWNWEKYDDWCVGTKSGETYAESWTCKSKQPKIGDHVFLIKLGDEPCGIIAHGFVSKESYDAPVFDSEKAEQGKTCPHIDVEFDAIQNYKNEDILKIETLQTELPSQTWCPQFSGSQIKEENESKLLELWNELNGEKTMSTKNPLVENLANLLKNTHNLILHGAPGTGKTHLAHEIAKELGCSKNEVGFVQFHPSYDYTDFVEGLRPVKSSDGTSSIGFERKDGVFKEFCKRALKNLIDSKKSVEDLQKEISTDEQIEIFLEKAIDDGTEFEIAHGNKFKIEDSSDKSILISIPANKITNELSLPKNDLVQLLNSDTEIESGADIKSFFNRKWRTQQDSYILTLYNEIKSQKQKQTQPAQNVQKIEKKNFLFIIDEINRGELSKIFGELFYAIEPGYRVKYEDLQKNLSREKLLNTIRTQYANLETCGNEFDRALGIKDVENFGHFFIPENVFIIGTMNDIDRSVDTMDFAFRRRFTFYEVKAEDTIEMLDEIKDESIRETAISKMTNLNNAISAIEGLNSSYHIGGAYFLKLNDFSGSTEEKFAQLWNYHLEGLLREYLRGRDDAETKLAELKKAYDNTVVELVETTSQSDEVSHSERSE